MILLQHKKHWQSQIHRAGIWERKYSARFVANNVNKHSPVKSGRLMGEYEMRDYKTNTYYSCKPDLPMIIGAIVCGYLVAELAWIEIFNYFGF